MGQISTVSLANHPIINGTYTEIDLLIGKLKKRLNILIVASNLLHKALQGSGMMGLTLLLNCNCNGDYAVGICNKD